MSEESKPNNFIKTIIDKDLAENKSKPVATRFPPEPNGYLHIGHAKSICLNFGLATEYSGTCNLRFDDSNPAKEDNEYVESIKEDLKWLGFEPEERVYFASDYFEEMYQHALKLIEAGKAYVCSLSAEEMREYRGTLTEPGKDSPYRERSIEENLDFFKRMKAGEFEKGEHLLRAKIDMASGNINLRDPALYRIKTACHHHTGNDWSIYPMYDFCHCVSDSIEGITYSLCTLEFEDHRPLYDWILNELDIHHPRQIEFARLNLNYMVLSKRKLLELVEDKHVAGWDDPRLPTIAGLRRRGYTAKAIRNFCESIGVAKANSTVDIGMLEFSLREDLNQVAQRRMVVSDPIKLIVENYPEGEIEELDADNNPNDPDAGKRKIKFSRELWIEREDFLEDAPKKYFRLTPGKEVRLVHAYYVTCTGFEKDADGNVTEVRCTYDPSTKGGWSEDKRKVKGTIHWVSTEDAKPITVNEYDRLFAVENPSEGVEDYKENINPDSLKVIEGCLAESSLLECKGGTPYQFLRQGYFCLDAKDSSSGNLVFNKTIGLRDSWAKAKSK